MGSPSRGKGSSSKLLTTKLLDLGSSRDGEFSSGVDDHEKGHLSKESGRRKDPSPDQRDEPSSPAGEAGEAEGWVLSDDDGNPVTTANNNGNSNRSCSDLMMRNTSTVESILRSMSNGSTILATDPWKLTRAVVHVEDAWKGRFSPCPPLEKKDAAAITIFKLRWKYRRLEFLVVHLLLGLSLLETPSWCSANLKCFWSCYPDFTRNYHMSTTYAVLIEGALLFLLASMSFVDMRSCGSDYWLGSRKSLYQSMWFKHATVLGYISVYLLALVVDVRIHSVCGYFRIFLYFCMHRRTVLVVTQLRHILGAVAEIWLLIFFNILLFAWGGVILFAGTDQGRISFPNLLEACWRLFVLFTTTNFPTIMMIALDEVRMTIVYFAVFVILNVFFLAPLSLAFIFNVFRGGQSGIPRMEEEIRLRSTAAAFKLLDDRGSGHVSNANLGAFLLEVHSMRGLASRELARLQELIDEASARTPEEPPSLLLSDFKDAVIVMDRSLQHAEWITEVQWYYPNLYQSPGFRRLTNIVKHQRITLWPGWCRTKRYSMQVMDALDTCLLVVSFIALIVTKSFTTSEETSLDHDWTQVFIILGFCISVGLCAVVRGWHNCIQRPTWVFNAIITSLSILVLTFAFFADSSSRALWSWRILRFLRVSHMALVAAFFPHLGFYIRTLLIMTKRAATPASVLLAWSLFMAVLGTQLFGGLVCIPSLAEGDESCDGTEVPVNDYTESGLSLLNFNDVPTSLVSLLVLFVVNDWQVIVDEFVEVSGTGWARAFFIVNYIIGVAVILNLVVTVVINSFWDEYKRTDKPAEALMQLHDAAAASARHHPAAGGIRDTRWSRSPLASPPGATDAADAAAATLPQPGGPASVRDVDDAVLGAEGGVIAGGVDGFIPGQGEVALLGGSNACASAALMAPHREIGLGWKALPSDEEATSNAAISAPASRRGSRDAGFGVVGSGAAQQQQPALPNGDEADMNAERTIARRASRRRLDVSGIA